MLILINIVYTLLTIFFVMIITQRLACFSVVWFRFLFEFIFKITKFMLKKMLLTKVASVNDDEVGRIVNKTKSRKIWQSA